MITERQRRLRGLGRSKGLKAQCDAAVQAQASGIDFADRFIAEGSIYSQISVLLVVERGAALLPEAIKKQERVLAELESRMRDFAKEHKFDCGL